MRFTIRSVVTQGIIQLTMTRINKLEGYPCKYKVEEKGDAFKEKKKL